MTPDYIHACVQGHRDFFATQNTKSVAFRKEQLLRLRAAILKYEKPLYEALQADLHKSEEEAFLTEISIVLQEIKHHLRHIDRWAKPQRVGSTLAILPSESYIITEPLGVALIMAPWNYPFNLLICPLVGAISSGCCAVLKPSPYTPHTAAVMEQMISETFPQNYISVVQGDRHVNALLLAERYDIIFFTGSPSLGKLVMEAAAKNLTPCVLELGGKSPCIVDKEANIKIAARRIMWGKTINAGQTCIAPDYLFVHESVKAELFAEMKQAIRDFFGENPETSPFFPRIVNDKAMERLLPLLQQGDIVFGGENNRAERYIAPTVIDNVQPDFAIMQEEIFGPILPVLTFNDINTVINYVNTHEKPLAFYYFGDHKKAKAVLAQTTSGGACVNDVLMHIANPKLPFGGVGNSGMGQYHHHESFIAFSNRRAVVHSFNWFDLKAKYVPFKGLKPLKRFLK